MLEKIKYLSKILLPKYQKIILEYPVKNEPRYGHGKPVHQQINQILQRNHDRYKEILNEIKTHLSFFKSIPLNKQDDLNATLVWNNEYLPGLDVLVLYTLITKYKPEHYIEIGSGNSTLVVKEAIKKNGLATRITSIDPFPRANIDEISNVVIRKPVEELFDFNFIQTLQPNDILFIDNSHRSLPNSDVTVCFLDIIPLVPKGVIIHIHDIYLPFDYPQFMCDRFYSEQYLLAVLLLNSKEFEVIMPNYYISQSNDLCVVLEQVWKALPESVEKHGGSFWFKKV